MCDQQPNGLGGIDGTSSAHRDQAVARFVAIAIQTEQDVFLGRVRVDLTEDNRWFSQRADDFLTSPAARRPGSVTTKAE